MGNVIKVKLKEDIGVGIAGIETDRFKAGDEGVVVDATPHVEKGRLAARFVVLLLAHEQIVVLGADELVIIDEPKVESNPQLEFAALLSEFVAATFALKEGGLDFAALQRMNFRKAEKPQDT